MSILTARFKATISFVDKRFEEVICMFAIALMASCTFLQFASRSFFGKSFAWPEELAIYCMAWAVYMGAAMCVRERGHLRIMIAVTKLPGHLPTVVVIFGDTLWLSFNLFMVFHGYEYIQLLWDQLYISPALHIDQKWPQMIVPIGFLLMSMRIIQSYYLWFKNGCQNFPT